MMYFAYLRQPKGSGDPRHDPFWEFGSFGATGCHSANLLHPRRSPLRIGDQIAFLQGGNAQIRLIFLTPPLKSIISLESGQRLELLWNRSAKPFTFDQAPLLIDNNGNSDFPAFRKALSLGGRTTLVGAAASRLRARTQPVDESIAAEIHVLNDCWHGARASNYIEAITHHTSAWYQYADQLQWSERKQRMRVLQSLRGESPCDPRPARNCVAGVG